MVLCLQSAFSACFEPRAPCSDSRGTGYAELVSGSDVGGLVEGLVGLLECPHIASPLVADKVVLLLLTMLSSDRARSRQASTTAAHRALKLAVLGALPT